LTNVFADGADQDFCQPQAIYAFSYAYSSWSNEGDYQGCERAMQVVRPLATKLDIEAQYAANMTTLEDQCGNINWDDEYSDDGLMAVQDKVSAQMIIEWLNANASNKVLLAAWEHININHLLPALGIPSSEVHTAMGMWNNAQFNSVLDVQFVQDSAGTWKYDAISYQWQGCPSEINDHCQYKSCTTDSCTNGTDKEDLKHACAGPTPAPPPPTCSSMHWGGCSPSPGTGTCEEHLKYSIQTEKKNCSVALDEIKSQCAACNLCTEVNCPANVRTSSNL
jgi:hypothetical protein